MSVVLIVVCVLSGSGLLAEGSATERAIQWVAASLIAMGYTTSRALVKKAALESPPA
jgi:hypothetical protein